MRKESLELIKQVLEIIGQYDMALTLRQIYYRLVAAQIIPNQQKYYAKLSRLCVIARDQGLLPEDSFADRLRQPQKISSWPDLNSFMKTVKNAYNKDKWINQSEYVEIWTEKDALRGVIQPITNKYDVTLLVVRGQVSRTAIYEAAQRFEKKNSENKVCNLLYFGDFDPSGLSIYSSLCQRISKMYHEGIDYRRLALTPQQIKKHKLPQDPAKKSDPNYGKFVHNYGDNVVELDALPPNVLQELITKSIAKYVDLELLDNTIKEEQKEMAKLKKIRFG